MPSTDSIPVIDMWAPIVPTAEIMADFAGFPEPMLGYLRVFFKREPTLEDLSLCALVDRAVFNAL